MPLPEPDTSGKTWQLFNPRQQGMSQSLYSTLSFCYGLFAFFSFTMPNQIMKPTTFIFCRPGIVAVRDRGQVIRALREVAAAPRQDPAEIARHSLQIWGCNLKPGRSQATPKSRDTKIKPLKTHTIYIAVRPTSSTKTQPIPGQSRSRVRPTIVRSTTQARASRAN